MTAHTANHPAPLSALLPQPPGTDPTPTIQADTDWMADRIEENADNEMMRQMGIRFGRVLQHLMVTEAIAERATATAKRPAHEHHHHGNTYQDRSTVSAPSLSQHTEHYAPGAIQHHHVEVIGNRGARLWVISKRLLLNPDAVAAFLPETNTLRWIAGGEMLLTAHESSRLLTFFQNDCQP